MTKQVKEKSSGKLGLCLVKEIKTETMWFKVFRCFFIIQPADKLITTHQQFDFHDFIKLGKEVLPAYSTCICGSVTMMHAGTGRGVCGHVAAAAVDRDWSTCTVGMETTQRCDGGEREGPGSSSGY